MKITLDIPDLSMESLIEEANEENTPLDQYILERIELVWEMAGNGVCEQCARKNIEEDKK